MNHNERGRVTGLPGTKTTVTLYPQTLSARVRNSVIRMVESRMVEGGWTSNSRKIAEALAEKYDLQVSVNNWNGVRVKGFTGESAQQIKEIAQADWVAWLIENPDYGKGYYYSCHVQAIAHIEGASPEFFITMYDKENIRKVREILAEQTSQELKDRTQLVSNLLRGTEPITLTTF